MPELLVVTEDFILKKVLS